MKPIIGIVGRACNTDLGFASICVDERCRKAVINHGGIPIVILPTQDITYVSSESKNINKMTDEEKSLINATINNCDGVIIPGGFRTYEYDYYIASYTKKHNIPTLGLCAGMQIMVKTEQEDVSYIRNESDMHYYDADYCHEVSINKNSMLYQILKKDIIKVNSYHNYHVSSPGVLSVSAVSSDGIIEAVEYPQNNFYMGVQWHPEIMCPYDEDNSKIIEAFVMACKEIQNKK